MTINNEKITLAKTMRNYNGTTTKLKYSAPGETMREHKELKGDRGISL